MHVSSGLGRVSGKLRRTSALVVGAGVLTLAGPSTTRADDAAQDFTLAGNPAGNWSYGGTPGIGAPFSLFLFTVTTAESLELWNDGIGPIGVGHNPTDSVIHPAGTTSVPPGTLVEHPGSAGEYVVVRWSAPVAGNVAVAATFEGRSGFNSSPLTTTDVHVLHDGVSLFDGVLNIGGAPNSAGFAGVRAVSPGDQIDFIVGAGNGSFFFDTTGLDATVTYQSTGVSSGTRGTASWTLEARPNPARDTVSLAVGAPGDSEVGIRIFDVRGRLVREMRTGSRRDVVWDAHDRAGRPVPAGVYFVRAQLGDAQASAQVMIIR